MASLAYQVTNFAYQGSTVFVYQGSIDGAVIQRPGGTSKKKHFRIKKPRITPTSVENNEVIVELTPPVNTFALQQVLTEMEQAGFDNIEIEEEDDALVLTFLLKET